MTYVFGGTLNFTLLLLLLLFDDDDVECRRQLSGMQVLDVVLNSLLFTQVGDAALSSSSSSSMF